MRPKPFQFKFSSLLLIAAFLLIGLTTSASHFRYMTVNWEVISTGPGGTVVEFNITQSWRRSFSYPSGFGAVPGPATAINQLKRTGTFDFGDGANTPMLITVNSINNAEDWFVGNATITHTYQGSLDRIARFNSCCRISGLGVNSDDPYDMRTVVTLSDPTNNSPVANTPPIFYVPINQVSNIQIAAFDPDSDPLSFSFASSSESGLTQPIPTTPNGPATLSPSGLISINTNGLPVGRKFATQVKVSDSRGATIPLDFVIQTVGVSTPPVFAYPPTPANASVINVGQGNTASFSLQASDADPGNIVEIFATGLPSGATLSGTPGNPTTYSFSWTPTGGDLGAYVIAFTAQDNLFAQANTSVTVFVKECSISATGATTDVSCFGSSDGSIDLTLSGDYGTPTYSWTGPNNFASSSEDISGLEAGNYSVTATGDFGLGCSTTETYTVGTSLDLTPPVLVNSTCLTHVYELNGSYSDEFGGSSLVSNGGTIGASGYSFGPQQGLSLSNAVNPDNYTIAMTLTINTTSSWRKLIDFKNLSVDEGVYNYSGYCEFYPTAISANQIITAGVPFDLLVTRDAQTNVFTAYINGIQQISFVDNNGDAKFTSNGNIVNFLMDDNITGNSEITAGFIDAIRIYDCPITPNQVSCRSDEYLVNDPGQCGAVFDFSMYATDNCSIAAIVSSPPSGSIFPIGTTTVTTIATDASGNKDSCTFDVTVTDNEAPVISCPANITASNDPGQCGAKVCYPVPLASDNCVPALPVGYTYLSNFGNSYYYLRNSYTDYATAEAEAIAAGGHLAVITSQSENDAISSAGGGFAFIGGNDLDAEGTFVWSNCEAYSFSNFAVNEPNGGIFENYLEFMTGGQWNDISGNASRSAIIEIEGASVFQTAGLPTNSLFPTGTTTNIFVVMDGSGNTDTCSFDVTVSDTELPIVNTMAASTTLVNGLASISALDVDSLSSDNCGIASVAVSPNTFDCNDIGSHTVTLTVTDINGNSASAPASVEVVGSIPSCSITSLPSSPVFTGGNPNVLYLGYGAQSTTLSATSTGGISWTYNWSGNTSLLSNTNTANPVFTPTAAGSHTYTLAVTNEYGCSSTCDITIDVIDASCGKANNPKVLVCHNGHTICISPNAVPAHLGNHAGDYLGPCVSAKKSGLITGGGNLNVMAYPSPYNSTFNIDIISASDSPVDIMVYGMDGQVLEVYDNIDSHETPQLGAGLANGMYIVSITQNGIIKRIKITKE